MVGCAALPATSDGFAQGDDGLLPTYMTRILGVRTTGSEQMRGAARIFSEPEGCDVIDHPLTRGRN